MYRAGNITKNTLAMVLAGGKGERLSPITMRRPKPAVPFGGKYKINKFPSTDSIEVKPNETMEDKRRQKDTDTQAGE